MRKSLIVVASACLTALGLIAIVPPMIVGMLIRKHLVRGLTFGALKQ